MAGNLSDTEFPAISYARAAMDGEHQFLKRPKYPDQVKSAVFSLYLYMSSHPGRWLIFAIFSLQLVFLLLIRSSHLIKFPSHPSPAAGIVAGKTQLSARGTLNEENPTPVTGIIAGTSENQEPPIPQIPPFPVRERPSILSLESSYLPSFGKNPSLLSPEKNPSVLSHEKASLSAPELQNPSFLSPENPSLQIHEYPTIPSPGNPAFPIKFPAKVCDSSTVYVYDLPPIFNHDLVKNCETLSPWGSRCKMLENGGFGRHASGLAHLVPFELEGSWFETDQFASELIFHARMLGHPCRTLEPESASAFFVPFYGGLAVGKYLWSNYSADERDHHSNLLLNWLENQIFWKRKLGSDHFMMLGRITWDFRRSKDEDWGGSFLHMPAMKNVTRLLIERNPWDQKDVGVPYPTGFHPKNSFEIRLWQSHVRKAKRSDLFSFAGAKRSAIRGDFRGVLLDQCAESKSCSAIDCSGGRCSNVSSPALGLFLGSQFCLQPRGDSFTRRSIFDCMIAGSIPVFFWRRTAYWQYEWHLPEEPTSYSVFISRDAVKNGTKIAKVLRDLPRERVEAMRETVIQTIPKLLYVYPEKGIGDLDDAFDVALNGVFQRFRSL